MTMAFIRARLRRLTGAPADERGFETAEYVIVIPVILLVIFGIIQGMLWYHGTNLVQRAASSGYQAASLYGATSSDGNSAATATAEQAGSVLENVKVNVTRTGTEVTSTVTAKAITIIPGIKTEISRTVSGPTERWVQ